jgi:inner membrane protein
MNKENSTIEKVGNWIRQSVTLKLITIIILALLLLIPTAMIINIIHERERLNDQAIHEVSSKWANRQTINGPILTIPVEYELETEEKMSKQIRYYNILPESLDMNGNINPEKLRRGIYEIVVYSSQLDINGDFKFDPHPDPNGMNEIKWDQAFLTIGISDLRGIKDDIVLNWNDQPLHVEPGSKIPNIIQSGVTINLPNMEKNIGQKFHFDFKLDLQGSHNLSFIPLGKTTEVSLQSNWNAPSFQGNFLPDVREVSESGFTSAWRVLQLNRNFPQSWTGQGHGNEIMQSAFGVDLILPLDDYQKTMRSAKYAIMNIALTFLIFFLVEILLRRKIHPLQYALVGFALCLFYILLISITEHSNFNLAYVISSLAVLTMISLYSYSIFKGIKFSLILALILASIYGFLFITLQVADYALLIGSIGLTIILAATMYFTRNINWYKLEMDTE